MWKRWSQYNKILDPAWLLLSHGQRECYCRSQAALLFGNPWPPDPWTVLNNRAPRSQDPPARWFLENTLACAHPRLLPRHLLRSPSIPTVRANFMCQFDRLGKPRKLVAYYFWCVCDRASRNEHLNRYRVKNMALVRLGVSSSLLKT